MAKMVLKNPSIMVHNVDLSDHISSVEINNTVDTVESTAFGTTGKTYLAGLEDATIGLTFHQDFSASEVEATLGTNIGAKSTVVVKPSTAAVGTDNPTYTAEVIISEWMPISGSVGELLEMSVTWPVNGTVTRATA